MLGGNTKERTSRILSVVAVLAAFTAIAFAAGWPAQSAHAQGLPARCNDDGDFGSTLESDTTWSADVYLGQNLTVRSNSTLTITAGTTVYFCGDYSLSIGGLFNPGRLVVLGEEDNPVTFEPAQGADRWGTLFFGDAADEGSHMMHTLLRKGGGPDPAAAEATVEISERASYWSGQDYSGPTLDHITIEDSGAYGMIVEIASSNDPTPPSLTNLTIRNSERAPMRIMAGAVGGLGYGNTFQGNKPNRIQVTEAEPGNSIPNDFIQFDARWRKQPVPYEILANILTRNGYADRAYSAWTIDPGVKMLMHPGRLLEIGSNDTAQLLAVGTEDEPIIIDRLNASSDNWRWIGFNPFNEVGSKLEHVQILHGGGTPGKDRGAIAKSNDTPLELNHVTVRNSATAGLYATDGNVTINNSTFDSNDLGVGVDGAQAVIRNSSFVNNQTAGLLNEEDSICVDAAGNYWGAANGPADAGTDTTACNDGGRTNAGNGAAVSDGVIYQPWLPSADPADLTDRSTISSDDKLWILANGQDAAELTITVRDGDGNPVPGKTVELETTLGDLEQPTQPTNAAGETTARITSTNAGDAYITARNVTDDEQLAARLGLVFWQGEGDAGGLIDPSGTPYLSPSLVVEGEPFQVGFPVILRLPMRNSRTNPVDVTVQYQVSSFGVGNTWTLVSTETKTLQPDEAWDAPGGFTPPDTQHRCVQYSMEWSDVGVQGAQSTVTMGNGLFGGQRNLKKADPPCDQPDASKLIPRPGGLGKVFKHFGNLADQSNKVNNCLASELTFAAQANADRDYTVLVTPQTFTPPALTTGDGVSQEQAEAGNAAARAAADVAALSVALAETQARVFSASQAEAWNDAARQLEHYGSLQRQRANALDAFAAALEDSLALTGEDPVFTTEDFADYLSDLEANGYPADVRQFHLDTGLSDAQIDAMEDRTIEAMQQAGYVSVGFSEILAQLRDQAQTEAADIRKLYPDRPIGGSVAAGEAAGAKRSAEENLYPLGLITEEFPVTNPLDRTATVELLVRSGNLPLTWQTTLSESSVELGPGESTTVTLSIDPGASEALVDVDTYVGVEGYIDGEFIGGALFQQRLPVENQNGPLYLPAIQSNQ